MEINGERWWTREEVVGQVIFKDCNIYENMPAGLSACYMDVETHK